MKGQEDAHSVYKKSLEEYDVSVTSRLESEQKIELLKVVAAEVSPLVAEINKLFLTLTLEQSKDAQIAASNSRVPINHRMAQSMREQLKSASGSDSEDIKTLLRKIDPKFVIEETLITMLRKLKELMDQLKLRFDIEQSFFDAYITDDIKNNLVNV